jgi:hypothetical protein
MTKCLQPMTDPVTALRIVRHNPSPMPGATCFQKLTFSIQKNRFRVHSYFASRRANTIWSRVVYTVNDQGGDVRVNRVGPNGACSEMPRNGDGSYSDSSIGLQETESWRRLSLWQSDSLIATSSISRVREAPNNVDVQRIGSGQGSYRSIPERFTPARAPLSGPVLARQREATRPHG